MAADRALAEDDQRAREDVRALHGDGDRRDLVAASDPVVRPEADALAAHDVHAVVHALARALGHVVFRDRREHRRLLAAVDRARGHDARRVHHVAVRGDAPQGLLDALEPADRRLELAAHPGVRADEAHQRLGAADGEVGSEIARPAARQPMSIIQPLPAYSRPPMIQSSGMNTSLPEFGPFWNAALSGMWRRPMLTRACSSERARR